ncbi:MAG: FecR domain-containing protein [Bacteroidota bacterium]
MINEEHIVHLAEKAVAGKLAAVEQRELEAWLAADPLNRQTFAELRDVLELTGTSLEAVDPQTDAQWEALAADIAAEEFPMGSERPLLPPARSQNRSWLVAAAVALLASVGFLVWRATTVGIGPLDKVVFVAENDAPRTVTLPDGTQVELEPGARIDLEEGYGRGERRIHLLGTAFFKVARDPDQPFVVLAGPTQTRVLGTQFWVRAFSPYYEVTVEVEEGKVEFSLPETEQKATLTADMQARYHEDQTEIAVGTAEVPLVDLDTMENQEGVLRVRDVPFGEVMRAMELVYDVKFELPEYMEKEPVTGTFSTRDLKLFLAAIELVFDGKFEEKDAIYRFIPRN